MRAFARVSVPELSAPQRPTSSRSPGAFFPVIGATVTGPLAVPVAACIARAFDFLRERQDSDGRDDGFRHHEAAVSDGQARRS